MTAILRRVNPMNLISAGSSLENVLVISDTESYIFVPNNGSQILTTSISLYGAKNKIGNSIFFEGKSAITQYNHFKSKISKENVLEGFDTKRIFGQNIVWENFTLKGEIYVKKELPLASFSRKLDIPAYLVL